MIVPVEIYNLLRIVCVPAGVSVIYGAIAYFINEDIGLAFVDSGALAMLAMMLVVFVYAL